MDIFWERKELKIVLTKSLILLILCYRLELKKVTVKGKIVFRITSIILTVILVFLFGVRLVCAQSCIPSEIAKKYYIFARKSTEDEVKGKKSSI